MKTELFVIQSSSKLYVISLIFIGLDPHFNSTVLVFISEKKKRVILNVLLTFFKPGLIPLRFFSRSMGQPCLKIAENFRDIYPVTRYRAFWLFVRSFITKPPITS